MSAWLDPVRCSLDEVPAPARFFFRDDDAGWEHGRLCELLDVFARLEAPIDVAAIPLSVTSDIAADLRAASAARPGKVNIHQHGFSHANHEREGRKAEFGPSRTEADVASDLSEGRRRLHDLIGPCIQPIFTPPWNRCTDAVVRCARELGFRVLSRDLSAGRANVPGIVETPVRLDWSGRRGVARGAEQWGRAMASAVQDGYPVGIMLHHGVMTSDDFRLITDLLEVLSQHAHARLETICAFSEEGAQP